MIFDQVKVTRVVVVLVVYVVVDLRQQHLFLLFLSFRVVFVTETNSKSENVQNVYCAALVVVAVAVAA